MRKELSPALKSFALQVALQLPDDQRDAISVLQYAREIVERRTRPRPRLPGPELKQALLVGRKFGTPTLRPLETGAAFY